MSLNAATIRLLAEKGLSAMDIAEVAEAMAGEQSRSSAAERQRRYRDRKRNDRDVTRDVTDERNAKENPPQTPHKENIPPVISDEMTSPTVENENSNDLRPEHVVEHWNSMAERTGLPAIRKLTLERRRKLAARIRDHPIDDWICVFDRIERSKFLRGENNRGWAANFDFLLQPSSFVKILEGTYDRT